MLTITTLNVRYPAPEDGPNRYPHRHARVVETLLRRAPDLIGLQEVTDDVFERLRADLSPRYRLEGCGREADLTGERCAVAIRRETLELMMLDTLWLSDTPRVPGSRFEGQSPCPRVCTFARVYSRAAGKSALFCNTHLDHWNDEAREAGLCALLRELRARRLPGEAAFLCGDFNCTPQSAPLAAMARIAPELADATETIPSTYHDFGRAVPEKIDYIFATLPSRFALRDAGSEGAFLSDHDAVTAGFVL